MSSFENPIGWAAKCIAGLFIVGGICCVVGGSVMPAIPIAAVAWVIWHIARAFDEG